MENSLPTSTPFCFANLTNKRSAMEAQNKKMTQNRYKKLLMNSLQRDCDSENRNLNLPQKTDLTEKAVGSENHLDEAVPSKTCPGVARTLRKVSVDYFLGKRVQFKAANVRISFEIVDSL